MADRSPQQSQPLQGTLSKEVERLTNSIINELSNLDTVGIDEYLLMATTDPICGAGIEVPMLMGALKLGKYHHDDENIQDWTRQNFVNMHGSLQLSFAEMWQAKPFGHSWSEISVEPKNGSWMLQSIMAVDPRYFRYAGSIGKIKEIRYRTVPEGLIDIPYEKGIHITNGRHINIGRDPYGFAECKKAYPYWKAKKLILAAMVIAAQRQATPLLVGKTDLESSFELVDSLGNILLNSETGLPIKGRAGDRMKSALEQIENQSVIVIDKAIDEITAIAQQTDGAFFLNVLRFLNSQILMAFLMPETVITTGSQGASGDSNLNAGHGAILDLVVSSFTQQIKERLIEDVCRFLIFNEFGEQESYGHFQEPEKNKTDSVALLGAIANASNSGVLGGNDLDVINRSRDLAGIPPIDQILIQQASRYKNMEIDMENQL
jgi:hypothetical protein